MEEKKVRRSIHFNDIEKMNRFRMLYGDLFQTLVNNFNGKFSKYWESSMEGYEYEFIFHMNKENFDVLKKIGIVKKIRQAPYKNDGFWTKGLKKKIFGFCVKHRPLYFLFFKGDY